jgi:hypothetical protein
MARNVRNFWIEASVDGRASEVATGPRAKDGGIDLTIYQRDAGSISTALRIRGRAAPDGTLTLWVEGPDGATLQRIVSHREDATQIKGLRGVQDVTILCE